MDASATATIHRPIHFLLYHLSLDGIKTNGSFQSHQFFLQVPNFEQRFEFLEHSIPHVREIFLFPDLNPTTQAKHGSEEIETSAVQLMKEPKGFQKRAESWNCYTVL